MILIAVLTVVFLAVFALIFLILLLIASAQMGEVANSPFKYSGGDDENDDKI